MDNRTVSMLQDGLVTVSFKFKKRAVGELYGVIKPSALYSEGNLLEDLNVYYTFNKFIIW